MVVADNDGRIGIYPLQALGERVELALSAYFERVLQFEMIVLAKPALPVAVRRC